MKYYLFTLLATFGLFFKAPGQARLNLIPSPILFEGDQKTAYRDPAIAYHDNCFYLFLTVVETEEDGKIYSYTAFSKSKNLVAWSEVKQLTPKDQRLNYSSPGNVIRYKGEWILCLQTYPRPGYMQGKGIMYGTEDARIFIMKSRDLEHWTAPEIIPVKGEIAIADMGRMIDPYLLRDKDDPEKWWCFYKQNGVSMSYTYDFRHWTYFGNHTGTGENVCVLVEDDRYVLFHSPHNGIGIKVSKDMRNWEDYGELITLGQRNWEWAKGRITGGSVVNLKQVPGIGKYVMFFHGSGPRSEREGDFDRNASIGIAWSDDLLEWSWPGK